MMLRCCYCKEEKDMDEFHNDSTSGRKRSYTCKPCALKKSRECYHKNKEATKATRYAQQKIIRNSNKQWAIDKFGGCCLDCKRSYPFCAYDFHHLDPSHKDVNPSKFLSYSRVRAEKELIGCVLLCANCHRIRHFGSTL